MPSTSIPANPSQPHPISPFMATEPLPEASSLIPIPSSVPTLAAPNLHPMQTRSKSNITKPNAKLCYKIVLNYTYTEPPTYKIASKYPKWCEAMDVEYQAL